MTNPLLQDWTTPFRLPPFDAITDEDFAPAVGAALTESRANIAAIADNPEAPDFAMFAVANRELLDLAQSCLH